MAIARILALALGFMVAAALPATAKKTAKPAAPSFPAYFTLPANVKIADEGGGRLSYEDFGEAMFYPTKNDDNYAVVKQGMHWAAPLELVNPPKDITAKGVWLAIKPALLAGGWISLIEYDSSSYGANLRYQKGGKDVWAYFQIFGADDIRLNLIEVAKQTTVLAINPPAATPEKVSAKSGDFPYLPPLAGSKLGTSGLGGQMSVRLPGAQDDQLVGTDSIKKFYPNPPGVSTIQFVAIYHDALTKAGWTIIQQSAGFGQTDATLTAHYARNGRDIWAYLHMGGEEYSIQVADAGAANDIARQLAKSCHVALYGVLFDFNKATLKPESDGVLERVLAFLKTDKTPKLEVQGHTDNVGSDAYNQTLSEARAKSVLAWLTAHGIEAARLSFKGYGKTVPVATNDTDDGRAKNRRVEIAKPGCGK